MATTRAIVVIESPYAAKTARGIELHLRYVRAAMRDCLLRGEAPYASHALYTQPGVLADEDPLERRLGIAAGFAFRQLAHMTVVYHDLGVTDGMLLGMMDSQERGIPVEFRSLEGWDPK